MKTTQSEDSLCREEPSAHSCGGRVSAGAGSAETLTDRVVEEAVARAVFGTGLGRRELIRAVGLGTAYAVLNSIFPMDTAKALAQETVKGIEKKDLTVAFIPITGATPIIMAEPMGFYKKHGLKATVRRASGWAMVRDWAINKEVDAAHMLSPMPLAITLGAGSPSVPYLMPAVENINGQAITLHNKHKGVKSAKDMKGFASACLSPIRCTTICCAITWRKAACIPTRTCKSGSCRLPKWSPT